MASAEAEDLGVGDGVGRAYEDGCVRAGVALALWGVPDPPPLRIPWLIGDAKRSAAVAIGSYQDALVGPVSRHGEKGDVGSYSK